MNWGHNLTLASLIFLSATALAWPYNASLLTDLLLHAVDGSRTPPHGSLPFYHLPLEASRHSDEGHGHHLQVQARRCHALQLDRSAALQMTGHTVLVSLSEESTTKYV
jgi:hypothetical protein